jgi:zinc protease
VTALVLTALLCSASPEAAEAVAAPAPEHYRLGNGLEVILAPDPRRTRAAVNVWYHVGADHEPEDRRGLAHLVEHLMFEGSTHVGRGGHVAHLRAVGADALNAHTGRHRTRYLTTVLPEGLETVLWLEADRMGFLLGGLTAAAFERERAVVLRERSERVDLSAYGQADAKLWQNLFPPGHPHHTRIEGRAVDLQATTFEDARRFIHRWYGPNNATLVITGRFDPAEARALVDRYFAPLEGRRHPRRPAIRPVRRRSPVVVEHREPVGRRPAVVMGWHGPAMGRPEAVVGAVVAELLGGGASGLLHRRLVRELGLAERVHVRFSEQAAQSVLRIRVVARPGADLDAVQAAVDELLGTLRDGDVDAAALGRARRRWMTRQAASLDGAHGLVEAAERIHRQARGLAPTDCVDAGSIDAEAVADYVRAYLPARRRALVVAVPPSAAPRMAVSSAAEMGGPLDGDGGPLP